MIHHGSADISVPNQHGVTVPRIIFDTDMSGDCDDVGALAILNKMEDFGECQILACVSNGHDTDKAVAASIDAINTYYGRPNIPIGTYQGTKGQATQSKYTAALRDGFPHTAKPDDQEPYARNIYRSVLASAPDGSVTIVSVGFLMNLRELLESSADDISPLSGSDLVRRKVKQLVVMGGQYPKDDPSAEYNFSYFGAGPDTQFVAEKWPTPILFSGVEIGSAIITGKKVALTPADNPVRRAYQLYTNFQGRQSWDLTAALAAVRPPQLYWNLVAGHCVVSPDGGDSWASEPRGQSYLAAREPASAIADVLEDLMTLPPRDKAP